MVTEDEIVGWHLQFNGHGLKKLQEIMKEREVWHAAVHGLQRVGHNFD